MPVPNLTEWRRGAVGDMTSAFDFSSAPNAGVPVMTDPGPRLQAAIAQCGPNVAAGTLNAGAPYPVPPNSMPVQEQSPLRRRPSGLIM